MKNSKKIIVIAILIISIVLSLSACNTKNEIKIYFSTNGGSEIACLVSDGESEVSLPSPTKEGFTFGGWFFDDGTFEQQVTATSLLEKPVSSDITIYAKWIPITTDTYTLSFDTKGGSAIDPLVIEAGSVITLPANPVKAGYTFDKWCTDGELADAFTLVNMPEYEFTLYAKWAIDNYTISFEVNGGVQIDAINYTIESNDIILPIPQKSNNAFSGWYADREYSENAVNAVSKGSTGNKTFYAKWTPDIFLLTFETNGGNNIDIISGEAGSAVEKPADPLKTGYSFEGWYSDSGLNTVYVIDKMPAENITIYAKWSLVQYTLSFEENQGNEVEDISFNILTDSFDLPTPTREKHVFDGWYDNIELSGNRVTSVAKGTTGNRIYYAKWIAEYTLTFDSCGGTAVAGITEIAGATITMPANPEKPEYAFDNWYADSNYTEVFVFDKMPAENITVYAKWIPMNSITFNSNGGSAVAPLFEVVGRPIFKPSNPEKLGYSFNDWYTDSDLTLLFTFDTMPASNITLYAEWYIVRYNIYFMENDGTNVEDISYSIEEEVIFETPEKENYLFGGWYDNEDLSGEPYALLSKGNTEHKTFYAKWTPEPFNITYELDDGINNEANPASYTVETDTFSILAPSKQGYNFMGWYLADLTTPAETTIMLGSAGARAFYAVWELINEGLMFAPINEDSEYEVSSGTCTDTSIEIPAIYQGKPVTVIAASGFSFKSITDIILPNSITVIGANAFEECERLVNINLPESLEYIGESAFTYCKRLLSINIPGSVKVLNNNTLSYCMSLKSVTLNEGTEYLSSYLFWMCTSLKNVILPNTVIEMRDEIFGHCKELESVFIPDSVTIIGYDLFYDASKVIIFCEVDSIPIGWEEEWNFDNWPVIWAYDGTNRTYTFNSSAGTPVLTVTAPYVSAAPSYSEEGSFIGWFDSEGVLATFPYSSRTFVELNARFTQEPAFDGKGFYTAYIAEQDVLYEIVLDTTGQKVYYSFTPVVTAEYSIRTSGGNDTLLYLYNSGMELIYSNDDRNEITCDSEIVYLLNEGETYFIVIKEYSNDTSTFDFIIEEYIPYGGSIQTMWDEKGELFSQLTGYAITDFQIGSSEEYGIEFNFSNILAFEGLVFGAECELSLINGGLAYLNEAFDGIMKFRQLGNAPIIVGDICSFDYLMEGNFYETADAYFSKDMSVLLRYKGELEEFTVPDSVIKIGSFAFGGYSNLTKVTLPDGITDICSAAFVSCSNLAEINIPVNLVRLEYSVFSGCLALTEIILPEGLQYIGSDCFSYCRNLESINLPDSLVEIDGYAFANCITLREVTIPDGITVIKCGLFSNCRNLLAINLPETIISIESYAFAGCKSLTEIILPQGVTEIGSQAFLRCIALTEIVIPRNVTVIGTQTFLGCVSLVSVTLPQNLTSIGNDAFSSCSSLKSINLSEGLESIGESAFDGCIELEFIIIPASVTYIGFSAFKNCSSLVIFCYPEERPVDWNAEWTEGCVAIIWGYDTIERAYSFDSMGGAPIADITTVYLDSFPEASKAGYKIVNWYDNAELSGSPIILPYFSKTKLTLYAEWELINSELSFVLINENTEYEVSLRPCLDKEIFLPLYYNGLPVTTIAEGGFAERGITSIVFTPNITTINRYSFYLNNFENIILPDNLTEIGENSFSCCKRLKGVILPEGITVINGGLFQGCVKLESVEILGELTAIGPSAFSECNKLTGIALPDSVQEIGANAFEMSGLRSIIIPQGITTINDNVFRECINLESVQLPDSLININSNAFLKCVSLSSINFGQMLEFIGQSAFELCSNLTEIIIPENPDPNRKLLIESSAFLSCIAVTNISLPLGIPIIYGSVFEGCIQLTSVILPESVTEIREYAFYSCYELIDITLPVSLGKIGYDVFDYCRKLEIITIPLSVTIINSVAFYSCDNLTIQCEADSKPVGWNDDWNLQNRPVVWGYDGIESTFTFDSAGGSSVDDITACYLTKAPLTIREGYYFNGWFDSLNNQITYPYYNRDELTLYARWNSEKVEDGTNIYSAYPLAVDTVNEVTIDTAAEIVYYSFTPEKTANYTFKSDFEATEAILYSGSAEFLIFSDYNELYYTLSFFIDYLLNAGETYYLAVKYQDDIPSGSFTFYAYESIPYDGSLFYMWYEVMQENFLSANAYIDSIDIHCFLGDEAESLGYSYEYFDQVIRYQDVILGAKCDLSKVDETIAFLNDYYSESNFTYKQYQNTGIVIICDYLYFDSIIEERLIYETDAIFNEDRTVLISYKGKYDEYAVPEGIISIYDYAFFSAETKKVTLPSSLTNIGNWAFITSQLEEITIPDSVTFLGEGVFKSCNYLSKVILSDSLSILKNELFNECSSLVDVTLPVNLVEIGESAFYYCSNLENIDFPTTLESISNEAFRCCYDLVTLNLPDGLIYIGDYAFSECNSLVSVILPDSVTQMGSNAFSNCVYLTDFTFSELLTTVPTNCLSDCTSLTNVNLANITKIDLSAFASCTALEYIDLSKITDIMDSAFYNCTMLDNITFSENLTHLDNSSFMSCKALKSVNLPSSVIVVGQGVFYNCLSLETVELSSAVTEICQQAFYSCVKLTALIINAVNPPALGNNALSGIANLAIYVPPSSVDAYKAAEGWSAYQDKIFAIAAP